MYARFFGLKMVLIVSMININSELLLHLSCENLRASDYYCRASWPDGDDALRWWEERARDDLRTVINYTRPSVAAWVPVSALHPPFYIRLSAAGRSP